MKQTWIKWLPAFTTFDLICYANANSCLCVSSVEGVLFMLQYLRLQTLAFASFTHLPSGCVINYFDLLSLLIVSLHQDCNDHILIDSCEVQVVLYINIL